MKGAKKVALELLATADIRVGGKKPWDITVHNERFYDRVLSQAELGLGESYIDGDWDCEAIDQMIAKIHQADIAKHVKISPKMLKALFSAKVNNRQTKKLAKANAEHHYNIGNDLYAKMLGQTMVYSCAYWKNTKNLDQAQINKLDLICQKLELKPGMTLLDVGCGWGGLAEHAAKNYGVEVTGITPASEQFKYARERVKSLNVKIKLLDYRDATGQYDRIVSVGMLEHVGPKNYQKFFDKCHQLLKKDGMMLHHTIGSNNSVESTDPWTDKYIFPGGVIPSIAQLSQSIENKFMIEDLHSFGPYYDKTLMAWYHNFVESYPDLVTQYDQRFYRMWTYYLLVCAGSFRARHLQLWQIVMRPIATQQIYTRHD